MYIDAALEVIAPGTTLTNPLVSSNLNKIHTVDWKDLRALVTLASVTAAGDVTLLVETSADGSTGWLSAASFWLREGADGVNPSTDYVAEGSYNLPMGFLEKSLDYVRFSIVGATAGTAGIQMTVGIQSNDNNT